MSAEAVQQHTLRHGKAMTALPNHPPAPPAKQLITWMGGNMIPIIEPGVGTGDARQHMQLLWRETRLCCARYQNQVQPVYRVILGGVSAATSW